jgi:hypothetical protein
MWRCAWKAAGSWCVGRPEPPTFLELLGRRRRSTASCPALREVLHRVSSSSESEDRRHHGDSRPLRLPGSTEKW